MLVAACGQSDSTPANPAPQPPADDTAEASGSGSGQQFEPSADAEPLARDEFVAQASVICGEASAAVDALPSPDSLIELGQRVPELEDIAQRELDGLRALGQPADPSERINPAYFSLLQEQLDLLGELGEAASREDLVGAREILTRAAALNAQTSTIASEYGLDACIDSDDAADVADIEPGEPVAPQTPTEAFVAAADVICSSSRELVSSLREPQTQEEAVASLREVVDISTEELRQLRELDAPAALAARYTELLSAREEQIAALRVFGEALEADDREAASQALLENSRLNDATNVLQQELGFEVCGTEPVQVVPNQRRSPAPEEDSP